MTIHLAATPVWIADRGIQRCFICGAMLVDTLGCEYAVSEDGSPPGPTFWEVGAWVSEEGSPEMTHWGKVGQTETPSIPTADIPVGCCVDLIE
jgi:hypothetical protein